MSNTTTPKRGPEVSLEVNCLTGGISRAQNRTESEEPWKRLEIDLQIDIDNALAKFTHLAISYFRWLLAGHNLERHAIWISGGMGSMYLCCGSRMPEDYASRGGKIDDLLINPSPKLISEMKTSNDCIARLQEIDQIIRSRSDWPESIIGCEIYLHSTPTKH